METVLMLLSPVMIMLFFCGLASLGSISKSADRTKKIQRTIPPASTRPRTSGTPRKSKVPGCDVESSYSLGKHDRRDHQYVEEMDHVNSRETYHRRANRFHFSADPCDYESNVKRGKHVYDDPWDF